MKTKKATRALKLAINKNICPKSKRSQEEMVGFALIIIIVAIVLLVFLAFTINKPKKENLESFEVKNFLDAFLTYTSDCRNYRNSEFSSIGDLISDCSKALKCYDDRETCEVLESNLNQITKASWDMTRYNGYELKIVKRNQTIILVIKAGNETSNSKSYLEEVDNIEVFFKVYY
jgi:hypothetical protein